MSTPPSGPPACELLVGPGGMSGLGRVGVHSSILVQQLASLLVQPGACLDLDEWVSTRPSWYDPCTDWSDQGASLDLEEWVSTPPSWSDSLHHYWSDQGHVWTQMS